MLTTADMALLQGAFALLQSGDVAGAQAKLATLPDEKMQHPDVVHLLALIMINLGETDEARFAHAADRAMPVLLNLANNGQSWVENGISHQRVVKRLKDPIQAGCPALWDYLETQLEDARERGWFGA